MLRAFYLDLRARSAGGGGAPITTRQLEALVRLAEARARADLRQVRTPAPGCSCSVQGLHGSVRNAMSLPFFAWDPLCRRPPGALTQ